MDSRFWGNIKIRDIEGKALFIYWSDEGGRFGKKLQLSWGRGKAADIIYQTARPSYR